LSKLPAFHILGQEKEFKPSNVIAFKFDYDEEELFSEIYDLVKGNLVDIAEKTLGQWLTSNVQQRKITFCYLHKGGQEIPLAYWALSGLKEF